MKKILVVEDDTFLANAYRVKLAKSGFDVKIAYDGDEALSILGSFLPDIIILDLVLPKQDGFSVLAQVKANPTYKNIPVVVASNLGQKEDIDKSMKLGAVDYIVKADIVLDDLVAKINSLVK